MSIVAQPFARKGLLSLHRYLEVELLSVPFVLEPFLMSFPQLCFMMACEC